MCVDGVSRLVMGNLTIQNLMSNPILDIVHKQVVMTLYSLAADHCLHEYEKILPVYLSADWATVLGHFGHHRASRFTHKDRRRHNPDLSHRRGGSRRFLRLPVTLHLHIKSPLPPFSKGGKEAIRNSPFCKGG